MTSHDKLIKLFEIKRNIERYGVIQQELDDLVQMVDEVEQKSDGSKVVKCEVPIKSIFSDLNDAIYKLCNHKWIEDYIDLDCESSMKIKYCEKCELSYREWTE
jgi:hypothetical protein